MKSKEYFYNLDKITNESNISYKEILKDLEHISKKLLYSIIKRKSYLYSLKKDILYSWPKYFKKHLQIGQLLRGSKSKKVISFLQYFLKKMLNIEQKDNIMGRSVLFESQSTIFYETIIPI